MDIASPIVQEAPVPAVNKLKPEIKELWLEALRNETFRQAKHCLRISDDNGGYNYCCLGVATQLYADSEVNADKKDWTLPEGERFFRFDGEESLLPKPVAEWMGLASAHGGYLNVPAEMRNQYSLHEREQFLLAELNDRGVSFQDLATLIEEQL